MCKRIFEENQRFNQWWLWLGMASLVGIFIYQRYPIEVNNEFIITFGVLGLVVVFLFSIHLVTRIDVNGIHVKMFPFHLRKVTYAWEELYSAEVVEYSPISEYGGWGFRISTNGKVFSVKGNKSIKIQTSDGKGRMIGTQKFEEAKAIVSSYQEQIK